MAALRLMMGIFVAVIPVAARPAIAQAPAPAAPALHSLPPPVVPACISSPFGPRAAVGPRAARFHNGIDFPAPAGAAVRAVAPGQVVAIRRLGSEGLEVDIRHAVPGGFYLTRYAHLGQVAPALAGGATAVAAGMQIGRVGRTGVTYGTHVHFELHVAGAPIDGEPYFTVPRCH